MDLLPLSCLVCDKGLGFLLRGGRKTDSRWDPLMHMPTKEGDRYVANPVGIASIRAGRISQLFTML